MYSFKKSNGVSLCLDGKNILNNITPWINPVLRPQDGASSEGKTFLNLVKCEDTAVYFEDKTAKLTVSLKQGDGCFAVFLKCEYDPSGHFGVGTHLSPFGGIGFDFDLSHDGNYIDAFMRCPFWQRPFIGKDIRDLKPRTQSLLFSQENSKTYLMSVCDKHYKNVLNPSDGRVSLAAHSNTVLDSIDECVLLGARDLDDYELFEKCVRFGLKVMSKGTKMRRQKKYPEVMEYLGWCSWDAFHMDITADNLLDKAKEFDEKGIPVRWMILDDMWGDVTANDIPTMHGRELNDWEADPKRFPNGLKGAITMLKERYDLKVGIWHPISGYWYGINPCGELAKREKKLLEYTISSTPRLMHSFEKKKIDAYYDKQHAFYKSCNVDFTKVDNQGSMESFSHRKGSIGECVKNMHGAIEKAAKKYYGGALINCMGMPVESFWNRKSNINRFSGDFKPEDRKWFIQHLLQCGYNSLTQGTLYTGDWDMWWSDDKQAKKNAVLRSMSGGPIYVSDRLGCSVKDVIMPTVFSNGRIIRLPDPALPTRDCLFENAEHNGKIFKVFNRIGSNGVIAAFNLDEDEHEVVGEVRVSDVEGLKAGRYCVYDWFEKKAVVIEDGAIPLTLKNYDDFRLFLLVPIRSKCAVIGLMEKYMAPATVKVTRNRVTALDDGTLVVYSEKSLAGFDLIDENLYSMKVKKGQTVIL